METLVETMYIETCCNCGTTFAFTKGFYDQRQQDGKGFYCPNGHNQYYTNNQAKKLEDAQKALDRAESNAKYYREEAEAKARSLSATRGQITKIKNRIAKGVCPCCNRSFEDLHNHMETKHPNYVEKQKE